jgi:two-component sensor histidine kinase
MALIHQQLYRTKDLSRINFSDYLYELCSYLLFVNDTGNRNIKFIIDAEELYFGIDTALPCGLIINELFTNSVKHAFPDGREGSITVKFRKETGNRYTLSIIDDGIGAVNFDPENTSSLGMELVNTLTAQLEGELSMKVNNGTEIRICFKEQS